MVMGSDTDLFSGVPLGFLLFRIPFDVGFSLDFCSFSQEAIILSAYSFFGCEIFWDQLFIHFLIQRFNISRKGFIQYCN